MAGVIPIGANAQDIQAAKVFRVNMAADIAKIIAGNTGFLSNGKPMLGAKALAAYAFEVSQYFANEIMERDQERGICS